MIEMSRTQAKEAVQGLGKSLRLYRIWRLAGPGVDPAEWSREVYIRETRKTGLPLVDIEVLKADLDRCAEYAADALSELPTEFGRYNAPWESLAELVLMAPEELMTTGEAELVRARVAKGQRLSEAVLVVALRKHASKELNLNLQEE